MTGRLLKADDRQLEALVLRGRAYFYLVMRGGGTRSWSVGLLLAAPAFGKSHLLCKPLKLSGRGTGNVSQAPSGLRCAHTS